MVFSKKLKVNLKDNLSQGRAGARRLITGLRYGYINIKRYLELFNNNNNNNNNNI